MDPCRGVLELPAPRPKLCKVEKESRGLILELGIPYENGGPVALWVKGAVAVAIYELGPLLEVEAIETMVVQAGDGGFGDRIPPVTTTMARILGFPEEEIPFDSITARFKGAERSFNRGWSGVVSCDPVASKDPCWSSFRLSGGGGVSSVTGDKPRSLRDQRSS